MTLAEYITRHLAKPFKWGENDCVLFAAEWVKISTGKDYLAELPKWTTAKEALRIVQSLGGLEAALDERFTRINPHTAKDGDIALYKGCMCIFSGPKIVGPNINGLEFVKRTAAECAWSL